ncbi:hypothetical protein B5E62_10045 [Lachnoclostridium sp. An118]|nr:hypothetical protein B5E62_10045 [Lachnoclostridium sp. An118]
MLASAVNFHVWLNIENGPAAVIRDVLERFYRRIIPSLLISGAGYILFAELTFIAGTVMIVFLLNHLAGMLPDTELQGVSGKYRFVYRTSFLCDVFAGLFLELAAAAGLGGMTEILTGESAAAWLFMLFFVCGSVLYWRSILPAAQYHKVWNLLKADREYEDQVWYCISNGREGLSTFDRVPWKGKISQIIVAGEDLKALDAGVKMETFVYYLICIDSDEDIREEFVSRIYSALNTPHSRLLVLSFGYGKNGIDVKRLLGVLSENSNVRTEEFPDLKLHGRMDIESLISDQNFRRKRNVRMPLRFVKNEELADTYLSIGKGPCLCLQFLRKILNDLEILPAIYAVFDFTDLQYRMAAAYEHGDDTAWMKEHGKDIGNIMSMGKELEESVIRKKFQQGDIRITFEEIFSRIITEEEMAVIRKYLPDYRPDRTYPVYTSIVYLTTSLRNVLRGHGSFEHVDAEILFELVFKLALMNILILSANDLTLETEDSPVWPGETYRKVIGRKNSDTVRNMSPFLMASGTGNILVFNNWDKPSKKKMKKKLWNILITWMER